ncbi:DMT family transporter [Alphaproteobacteria bacterium]|nr:DMT family transporter [Alphaproteobacteria bacterium]
MSQLESKKHLIYILGTLAFFLFTIADTIIKLIGDLHKDTVIFSIASFSAIIPVCIYLFYRQSLTEIKTTNYKLHIVRGILMTLTYYFIVKGIILLPLSIAYPIILSAPVLLSVLGIVILKESVNFSKIFSLVLAMTAVFLVSGFSLSEGFDAQGVIFLVLGVIALACLDFSVRVFGKDERTMALTFYSMLFSGAVFLIFSLNHFGNILLNDLLMMISAGLIDGVAMMILIYSLRRIEASFFSITHYSQIIFGIIISIFIFNHYPSSIELLGAAMIIISGYLIYAKLKKLN